MISILCWKNCYRLPVILYIVTVIRQWIPSCPRFWSLYCFSYCTWMILIKLRVYLYGKITMILFLLKVGKFYSLRNLVWNDCHFLYESWITYSLLLLFILFKKITKLVCRHVHTISELLQNPIGVVQYHFFIPTFYIILYTIQSWTCRKLYILIPTWSNVIMYCKIIIMWDGITFILLDYRYEKLVLIMCLSFLYYHKLVILW